jgi:hypothetical protein
MAFPENDGVTRASLVEIALRVFRIGFNLPHLLRPSSIPGCNIIGGQSADGKGEWHGPIDLPGGNAPDGVQ